MRWIKRTPPMRKTLLILFLSFIVPTVTWAAEITVAVASSVQYPFEEIQAAFAKEAPELTIKPIYGSSGKFVTQIENGAPFDVFLSADLEYPQRLEKEGLTEKEPRIYAYGKLILW